MKCSTSVDSFVSLKLFAREDRDEQGKTRYKECLPSEQCGQFKLKS